MVKTQVQLDEVNRLLMRKRLEFNDRMQALEQRRAVLLEKQEDVRNQGCVFVLWCIV